MVFCTIRIKTNCQIGDYLICSFKFSVVCCTKNIWAGLDMVIFYSFLFTNLQHTVSPYLCFTSQQVCGCLMVFYFCIFDNIIFYFHILHYSAF